MILRSLPDKLATSLRIGAVDLQTSALQVDGTDGQSRQLAPSQTGVGLEPNDEAVPSECRRQLLDLRVIEVITALVFPFRRSHALAWIPQ